MSKIAKLALGTVGFLIGLYIVTFYTGFNWFYVGLLATIYGGWTIGELRKNRH